jgi:hypothetical protein
MFPDGRAWLGEGNTIEEAYSPFPARITIFPVVARLYPFVGDAAETVAPAAPELALPVAALEPAAYFRYTLEVPNVHLADFALPEPANQE